jgi:hypothetical protein
LDGVVSPKNAASKNTLVGDSLENCPDLASNKDVGFLFLGVRVSNCAKSAQAQQIWGEA